MLNIQHLAIGYNSQALAHVPPFSLPKGEHCLILGKSGSGKTTLLYTLAALLEPVAGNVTLNDINPYTLSSEARDAFRGRHIGIVYQTLHLIPSLTVLENLLLAHYAADKVVDTNRAISLLERLHLADKAHEKPNRLSVGQQQRVAIARAAMNRPLLILGDEPTAALDDENCAAVMRVLLDTAAESESSLIIASHDARIKQHFQHCITL